ADGLPAAPADKDTIEVHDLNAWVTIGVDELDDATDDLAAIISQALSRKIAEQEDDAFANASGAGRPEGMAAAATVTHGVAAAAGQTVTGHQLKRLTIALPSQFRRNGDWLGHTSPEETIALLKDGAGRSLL
ncbi:phage major capsid protein, partial [Streptomyces sp. DH37]|uniref:phage major capsid protein n=1 Tax=Streptomyces sp. DH37 TaxID=3040122 RepID=UPI0024426C5F